MEANPESERTASRASSAIFLDPAESRGLLASLSRELSRPLFALRDEIAAFAAACSHTDDSALELSSSCERLLDLTRDFFDYARVTRESPASALKSLSISSWLSDVDRRFASLATCAGALAYRSRRGRFPRLDRPRPTRPTCRSSLEQRLEAPPRGGIGSSSCRVRRGGLLADRDS